MPQASSAWWPRAAADGPFPSSMGALELVGAVPGAAATGTTNETRSCNVGRPEGAPTMGSRLVSTGQAGARHARFETWLRSQRRCTPSHPCPSPDPRATNCMRPDSPRSSFAPAHHRRTGGRHDGEAPPFVLQKNAAQFTAYECMAHHRRSIHASKLCDDVLSCGRRPEPTSRRLGWREPLRAWSAPPLPPAGLVSRAAHGCPGDVPRDWRPEASLTARRGALSRADRHSRPPSPGWGRGGGRETRRRREHGVSSG